MFFEENSHDDIPIVAASLPSDQRHDTLDAKNSLEEGNSSTTRSNTADGIPLSPQQGRVFGKRI